MAILETINNHLIIIDYLVTRATQLKTTQIRILLNLNNKKWAFQVFMDHIKVGEVAHQSQKRRAKINLSKLLRT